MAARPARLPADFSVGVRIEGGRYGGQLRINHRELSLKPWSYPWATGRPPIRHAGTDVRVLRARLMPPWFNTHVLVESDRGTAVAGVAAWARRDVVAALKEAGFVVREEKGWIAIGAGTADWR